MLPQLPSYLRFEGINRGTWTMFTVSPSIRVSETTPIIIQNIVTAPQVWGRTMKKTLKKIGDDMSHQEVVSQ